MTFADCPVCGSPIGDPADATLMRDDVRDDDADDPGTVTYRHVYCDPADAPRDTSTTIEM